MLFRKIKHFLTLSKIDRQLFIKALMLLPVMALRVRYSSVKGAYGWLSSRASNFKLTPMEGETLLCQAYRTAGLVRKATNASIIKGKCLSQSLVLWHLLRIQNIDSELRLGFRKGENERPISIDNFNAHAWVEFQGAVLNDTPDVYERFVVFKESLLQSDVLPRREQTDS